MRASSPSCGPSTFHSGRVASAAACLALVGTLALGSCSVATVRHPTVLPLGPRCTTKLDAPIADLAIAGAIVGIAGLVTGLKCIMQSCGGEELVGLAVGAGVAVPFVASAGYGYATIALCRRITPGWELRDRDFPAPAAGPDVAKGSREGTEGEPCNWKGLPRNCRPGLMCIADRCGRFPVRATVPASPATVPASQLAPASQRARGQGCRLVPRSDCITGVGCAAGRCVDPGPR